MKILFNLNKHNQQRQHEKQRWIFPIHLAMYATYLRDKGHLVAWDAEDNGIYDQVIASESQIDVPFLDLPPADRVLTYAMNSKWMDNGNFKYLPATYMQVANGCWWGKCKFCVEQNNKHEVRPVDDCIKEIESCAKMGFKEIFDDSGTFPQGRWLDAFIDRLESIVDKPRLSCNWRVVDCDYHRLYRSGFRMLLFGIESANQETLNRINKGVKTSDVRYIRKAAEAGLEPHITAMFGYPWESDQDAERTLELVTHLLRKGYAKTAQASFYSPAQGGNAQESHRKYVPRIYEVWKHPAFWYHKIIDIKNMDDLRYLGRCVQEGVKACLKR